MNKNLFAPLPPMGWNSYDYYDTTVNEAQVRANADYMAAHLKEYGWEYIIVDIQWYARQAGSRRAEYQYIPFTSVAMDSLSRLLPDPERFPSSADGAGFGPLAEYIHSLGLKFGIHIMRGIPRLAAHSHMTTAGGADAAAVSDPYSICPWNPDMYGVRNTPEGQAYYDSLLELYAGWGVDYIKCDDISFTGLYHGRPYAGRHEVEMLHRAIEKTGRSIVLSLSPGPAVIEEAWHYEKHANMWRVSDDFWDSWKALRRMFDYCEVWQSHVSPGCYPDCDMLPIGRVGKGFGEERSSNFTPEESKTMMTLWCIFGSPLMAGCELTLLDDATLALLTNKALLSLLNPHAVRRQIRKDDSGAVWGLVLNGVLYAALFNFREEEAEISVSAAELSRELVPDGKEFCFQNAHDLWSGENLPADTNLLFAKAAPHGCRIFRLS